MLLTKLSMVKYIANAITSLRIIGSVVLLFFDVSSLPFYITYLLCGFSDMIDGTIARKTNAVTEFGSKLDTVADFVFVAVCLIKLLPLIHISVWLLTWIAVIAVFKTVNFARGFVRRKKLVALHTVLNKATGTLLFLLPFTLQSVEPTYSFAVVYIIATIAAIHEGYYKREMINKNLMERIMGKKLSEIRLEGLDEH